MAEQIRARFGIDPVLDEVAEDGLAGRLQQAASRASTARAAAAQRHAASAIAECDSLDEYTQRRLFSAVSEWAAAASKSLGAPDSPSVQARYAAQQKIVAGLEKAPEADRRRVLFALEHMASDPWATPADTALVHPGEDEKPRIDKMLATYRQQLLSGVDDTAVRDALSERLELLTETAAAAARQRGSEIKANPSREFELLWPKHVDRDELGGKIRNYAKVLDTAAKLDMNHPGARDIAKKLVQSRRGIDTMLAGEGLVDIERDQVRATLADLDAGNIRVPELLFADYRSAQPRDRDHVKESAYRAIKETGDEIRAVLVDAGVDEHVRHRLTAAVHEVTVTTGDVMAGRLVPAKALAALSQNRSALVKRMEQHRLAKLVQDQVLGKLDDLAGAAVQEGTVHRRADEQWAVRISAAPATPTRRHTTHPSVAHTWPTSSGTRASTRTSSPRGSPPTPGRRHRPQPLSPHRHRRGEPARPHPAADLTNGSGVGPGCKADSRTPFGKTIMSSAVLFSSVATICVPAHFY